MRVAFVGTRGIPARYGGFETAVEEIASRFVEHGIEARVYCRNQSGTTASHRGVELVHLPAIRTKSFETLSHTFLSVLHLLRHPVDVVLLFNGANAVLLPLLRLRRRPVAVHVDGLEWKRTKWSRAGRTMHRLGERMAVRLADAVIADAPGISRYYRERYDRDTDQITYGAPVLRGLGADRIAELGLSSRHYHLVVARLEPENHVDLVVEGFVGSQASMPLVVVGEARFGGEHVDAIRAAAGDDDRVRFVGAVWDQSLLDQLYANCLTYLHGHSVGGTNPSLLRAMGAGAAVVAFDVEFNSDIVGDQGEYFSLPGEVAAAVELAEGQPGLMRSRGEVGQRHVERAHRWSEVAIRYAELCRRLART